MILKKIIEEMVGRTDGEFEHMRCLLSWESALRVRDLAAQLGVPASRLLADLVEASLAEAESEWRSMNLERDSRKNPPTRSAELPYIPDSINRR